MDTTIRNLKRESGIANDGADALSLLTEARELRARTLATLVRRVALAARTRATQVSQTTRLHPAG